MALKSVVVAALTFVVMCGCAQNPAVTDVYTPSAVSSVPEGSSSGSLNPPAIDSGASAEDFRNNVGDTVRFSYDAYTVDAAAQSTLEKQAVWLNRYPMVTIVIEGHCDERGTREYNLALGARRASAVREFLISHGVSANRLETMSFGKERPICAASIENCWAQNRRGVSRINSGASS